MAKLCPKCGEREGNPLHAGWVCNVCFTHTYFKEAVPTQPQPKKKEEELVKTAYVAAGVGGMVWLLGGGFVVLAIILWTLQSAASEWKCVLSLGFFCS